MTHPQSPALFRGMTVNHEPDLEQCYRKQPSRSQPTRHYTDEEKQAIIDRACRVLNDFQKTHVLKKKPDWLKDDIGSTPSH